MSQRCTEMLLQRHHRDNGCSAWQQNKNIALVRFHWMTRNAANSRATGNGCALIAKEALRVNGISRGVRSRLWGTASLGYDLDSRSGQGQGRIAGQGIPVVHETQRVAARRAAEGHDHHRPLPRQLVVAPPRLQPHRAPARAQVLQPAAALKVVADLLTQVFTCWAVLTQITCKPTSEISEALVLLPIVRCRCTLSAPGRHGTAGAQSQGSCNTRLHTR